jgi:hypothetical protein
MALKARHGGARIAGFAFEDVIPKGPISRASQIQKSKE